MGGGVLRLLYPDSMLQRGRMRCAVEDTPVGHQIFHPATPELLRSVRDVCLRNGIRGISTSPARYVRVSSSVEATRFAPVSRSTCVLSSASAGGPHRPTRIRTSGNAARSLLTR